LAVVLPFVTLLFLIALDFCRLYYVTQTVQGCAEAAAVYAAGYGSANLSDAAAAGALQGPGATVVPNSVAARTEAGRLAAVAEGVSLSPPLQESNVQVTFTNGEARVTVSYDCTLLTSILGPSRVQTVSRSVAMTQIR
jgi:hypothetical protein